MSLVGPRPLPVRDYLLLEDWHRRRYRVLPGHDGPLADLGPLEPDVRRPRSPRLLLPRELVRVARHHDPREDRSRRAVSDAVPTKTPKIVAVASAADLDFRYGCTPAWWQLWKGLHDGRRRPHRHAVSRQGDRVAVVADGAEPAVPRGGDVRARARRRRAAEGRPVPAARRGAARRTRAPTGPCARSIWRYVTPRWRRHLESLLERERDVDAVDRLHRADVALPRHPDGAARALRRAGRLLRRRRADEPARVRRHGHRLQLLPRRRSRRSTTSSLSNSEGGLERLRELGARRAEAVFWAADPELFHPYDVEKEHDVFFYGYGDKFRREWMQTLVGEPSRAAPEHRLRARRPRLPRRHRPRARDRRRAVQRLRARDLGGARSTSTSRGARTRPSTRRRRAGRSSSRRPARRSSRTRSRGSSAGSSRAASCSSCRRAEEAVAAYRELLADPAQAEELGRRARERALDEHTYAHRARRCSSSSAIVGPAAAAGV